jgi:hypothetical protein
MASKIRQAHPAKGRICRIEEFHEHIPIISVPSCLSMLIFFWGTLYMNNKRALQSKKESAANAK